MTAQQNTDLAEISIDDLTQNEQELSAHLRLTLTRIVRWLRQHDPSDLTPAQVSAIALIDPRGPIRIGDLA